MAGLTKPPSPPTRARCSPVLPRVRWIEPPRPTPDACFLCSNQVGNSIILESLHADQRHGYLDAASCARCGSAWFPDVGRHRIDYPETVDLLRRPEFAMLVHHYLELVGGIEWKIALIEQLPFEGFASVLEVGCNAGAFLDYCRVAWEADVVGLEPSAYGVVGSDLLGLSILHGTMADAVELAGRTFDFVLATEVLEHVDDPVGFLREMRGFLAEEGVAAITTPRAAALTRETAPGELYAALSTGAHLFLASPEQLRRMVVEAGFSWCHIEPFGMTQLAVMSERPVEMSHVRDPGERVAAYYERRSEQLDGDDRTHLGDRLNAYIGARRSGATVGADREGSIETAMRAQFGIDRDRLGDLVERIDSCQTFADIGTAMPYRLPEYLLWRGHRDDINESTRTELWEVAAILAMRGLAIDPQNMFVYVDVLNSAIRSLDRRYPGRFGSRVRSDLEAAPEAGTLAIAEPDPLPAHVVWRKRLARVIPLAIRRSLARRRT